MRRKSNQSKVKKKRLPQGRCSVNFSTYSSYSFSGILFLLSVNHCGNFDATLFIGSYINSLHKSGVSVVVSLVLMMYIYTLIEENNFIFCKKSIDRLVINTLIFIRQSSVICFFSESININFIKTKKYLSKPAVVYESYMVTFSCFWRNDSQGHSAYSYVWLEEHQDSINI